VNFAGKGLLLIDADKGRRQELKKLLQELGAASVHSGGPHEWRYQVERTEHVHAVLLGPCPGTNEQLGLYEALREWRPHLPVLLYHGNGQSIPVDIELNAAFFVRVFEWPIKQSQLLPLLQQAIDYVMKQESAMTRSPELFRALVGKSGGIAHVRDLVARIASTDAAVLVLGESGTGKEVVARNLHYHSPRRGKPFMALNCSAIPEDLLESELLGHEKEVMAGGVGARRGRFELAEGGTLFLDEIGDMSPTMQAKLLRVIDERTYERVGGKHTLKTNVRVIAAASRDLERQREQGNFREDLYRRLNTFSIHMPPLRERTEDIPLLVAELNARLVRERGACIRLATSVMDLLQHYSWPGNVRELANLVERLASLYPDRTIEIEHLPMKYRAESKTVAAASSDPHTLQRVRLPSGGLDLKEYLSNVEYSLITQALSQSGGVVAHAAALLKLPRTTLVEKLRKYGVRGEGSGAGHDGAVSDEAPPV
jgi:sigma-54 dependent transcriptional regulator, flagellar regulatory protein